MVISSRKEYVKNISDINEFRSKIEKLLGKNSLVAKRLQLLEEEFQKDGYYGTNIDDFIDKRIIEASIKRGKSIDIFVRTIKELDGPYQVYEKAFRDEWINAHKELLALRSVKNILHDIYKILEIIADRRLMLINTDSLECLKNHQFSVEIIDDENTLLASEFQEKMFLEIKKYIDKVFEEIKKIIEKIKNSDYYQYRKTLSMNNPTISDTKEMTFNELFNDIYELTNVVDWRNSKSVTIEKSGNKYDKKILELSILLKIVHKKYDELESSLDSNSKSLMKEQLLDIDKLYYYFIDNYSTSTICNTLLALKTRLNTLNDIRILFDPNLQDTLKYIVDEITKSHEEIDEYQSLEKEVQMIMTLLETKLKEFEKRINYLQFLYDDKSKNEGKNK